MTIWVDGTVGNQKGFTLIITLVKRIIIAVVTVLPMVLFSRFTADAYALPANFPDLNQYQVVNVEKYTQHYFNGDMAEFKIANGTRCGFDFGDVILCLGYFYRAQTNSSARSQLVCQEITQDKVIRYEPKIVYNDKPAVITVENPKKCAHYDDIMILPVGYKISFKGNTCAAGKGNMIACTNGRFGFIISDTQAQVF